MIEVEIFRVGRTWKYLITTTRNDKEEPGVMKLGMSSELEAVQEAQKMVNNIKKPLEEIKWYKK
jgi:hypothetical protein